MPQWASWLSGCASASNDGSARTPTRPTPETRTGQACKAEARYRGRRYWRVAPAALAAAVARAVAFCAFAIELTLWK
jgi:hypothetical protein